MGVLGFDRYQMSGLLPSYRGNMQRGAMNRQEFEATVSRMLGFTYAEDTRGTTDALFQAFDMNKDGMIGWREFHMGMAMLCNGNMEERLQLAFNMFDANGTGFIEERELERLLMMLAGPWDAARAQGAAQQMMREADWSGDLSLIHI